MLANARQGMSLVELMAWCGHRSPASTMHYLRVRPARLTEAYAKADEAAYLVSVLVDAEAVQDGSAAEGAPWKYYDLGSSYCTHAFWSTCAHRLACAGCAFNVPKASSRGQALEAKASLERYLERVPLTADERSAVDGDLSKLDELLAKLAGVAAPDGDDGRRADLRRWGRGGAPRGHAADPAAGAPGEGRNRSHINTANTLTGMHIASVGGLAASIVEPRQVFKAAVLANAAAVLLAHNHPSGNPEPSREDVAVTRQLVEAGKVMGIPVHDHLIITDHGHTSLAERGLM